MASASDADDFLEKVADVTRLVSGLAEGTITPDYIDRRYGDKYMGAQAAPSTGASGDRGGCSGAGDVEGRSKASATPSLASRQTAGGPAAAPASEEEAGDAEEERKAKLMEKAMALKANYERKQKLRARYEDYVKGHDAEKNFGTDYNKWDMWCPEDEEDDMINSITPNSAAFRAMEKDIDERHNRMVEARQVAERMRVKGNEAFKGKQYSEALSLYQQGLASERTNMTLHANAAQAALKLNCFVQAIEHTDKALSIADFMHNDLRLPLCSKIYQRRATAYQATQQFGRAVKDLEAALEIEPNNKDLQQQLRKTRQAQEEQRKQRAVAKVMSGKEGASNAGGLDIEKLRQVEQLGRELVALAELGASIPAAEDIGHQKGPSLPIRPQKDVPLVPASESTAKRAATACTVLGGLLQDDDLCCVYLRESGGLKAAALVVCSGRSTSTEPDDRVAVAACVSLLNTACLNDGNLVLLPLMGVLAPVVRLLGSKYAPHAAAAARLLCTLCTNGDVRRCVSKELSSDVALSSLLAMLASCSQPGLQLTALTVLSNCMVDAPVKESMRRALTEGSAPGCDGDVSVGARDVSFGGSGVGTDASAVLVSLMRSTYEPLVERTLNLCGNMCGDASLRGTLVRAPGLLPSIVHACVRVCGATGSSTGDILSTQLAAANALYNLAIDPSAQAALLEQGLATKLLPSMLAANAMLSARTTGVLARCCKHASWQAQLDVEALSCNLMAVLSRCLEHSSTEAAADLEAGAHCGELDCSCAIALDATVRALALMTQNEAGVGARCVQDLLSLNAPALLLSVVKQLLPASTDMPSSLQPLRNLAVTKPTRESILGNTTLCIGHFSRNADVLPLLHKLDAVKPLIGVAYDGKGSAASKNAAIALARMAKHPGMMERLRALHGIEIIYQYVKP